MSEKVKMEQESIENYVMSAIRDAKEHQDTCDLSMALSQTIEYYSDRWNPARMEYVLKMLDILAGRLKKEMVYDESQWRQCGMDITNDSEFMDKVHCPECQKKILSPIIKNQNGRFYKCHECNTIFSLELDYNKALKCYICGEEDATSTLITRNNGEVFSVCSECFDFVQLIESCRGDE